MLIIKKRIRSFKSNVPFINEGNKIILGVGNIERFSRELSRIGLDVSKNGNTILPAVIGKHTFFNAEGKQVINKNLPKETVYYQREWCWKQWAGGGTTEEICKIVDIPRERYHRDFVLPPSIELSVATDNQGNKIVIAPAFEYKEKIEKDIIHIVNMFLEIFGECNIFKEDLEEIIKTKLIRLNWEVLPSGKYPWKKIKGFIDPVLQKLKKPSLIPIKHRFKEISKYNPTFCAIGHAGFRGYVVMGFEHKKLYLLESIYYGNATYVFDNNWEELSSKTKADILNENLQKYRLIHIKGWEKKVEQMIV